VATSSQSLLSFQLNKTGPNLMSEELPPRRESPERLKRFSSDETAPEEEGAKRLKTTPLAAGLPWAAQTVSSLAFAFAFALFVCLLVCLFVCLSCFCHPVVDLISLRLL